MSPIIEVTNLTKKYGDFSAVDSVSFTIETGEMFGFLGHNGAGKTTTINMLTTLLKPTGGTARVGGHDIIKNPMNVRSIIGYVPENVQLYDSLTAYENLEFFAHLSQVEDPKEAIKETLDSLYATSYADKRVRHLSKGMRQRIGLAQAILHKPKVLFLDEPSSGLDPTGIVELRDLLTWLNKKEQITIFMNTHLLSEVSRTCTSIGVLSHGRCRYHDTVENAMMKFQGEDALEQLYLSIKGSEDN